MKLLFSICVVAWLIPVVPVSAQENQSGTNTTAVAQDTKSAATKSTEEEWKEYSPTGAEAMFQMPKKPRYVERKFAPVQNKPPITFYLHQATVNAGKTSFLFGYHDLHETPQTKKEIEATLDGAVRGSVANVLGQMIGKPSAFKYENNFGRQFVYGYQYTPAAKSTTEAPPKPINFVVISRVLLVGKRQYQLTCLMERSIFDEQLAGKFLNSFKLAKTEQDTNGEGETKSKK